MKHYWWEILPWWLLRGRRKCRFTVGTYVKLPVRSSSCKFLGKGTWNCSIDTRLANVVCLQRLPRPSWNNHLVPIGNGIPSVYSRVFKPYLSWMARSYGGAFLFLDEVTVMRVRDIVYVREGILQTPLTCDRTSYGIDQPQAMIGCRAYRNRHNELLPVRQFSRLFREDVIGCTGLIDTRNSVPIGEETFTRSDRVPVRDFPTSMTIVRPADRYVYAIDEPTKRCPATVVVAVPLVYRCMRLTVSASRSLRRYTIEMILRGTVKDCASHQSYFVKIFAMDRLTNTSETHRRMPVNTKRIWP